MELDDVEEVQMDKSKGSGDPGHYEEEVIDVARSTWSCNIQEVHQIDMHMPKHRASRRTCHLGQHDPGQDYHLVSPVPKMQTPEVDPLPAKQTKQVEYKSPLLPVVGASNAQRPEVMQSGNAFT